MSVLDRNFKDIKETMALRFTSGNSIPIERTQITREQWETVTEYISYLEDTIEQLDEVAEEYLKVVNQ